MSENKGGGTKEGNCSGGNLRANTCSKCRLRVWKQKLNPIGMTKNVPLSPFTIYGTFLPVLKIPIARAPEASCFWTGLPTLETGSPGGRPKMTYLSFYSSHRTL